MDSCKRRFLASAVGATALLRWPQVAQAEAPWPSRPIQFIVPAGAGSGTDALARLMAQRLSAVLGQPIIVENRPGAAGILGVGAVIKAANDGYTFLYANASNAVIAPAVLRSIPYDASRDLIPVAQTAAGGVLLLVNKDVPAKNLQELIELVRSSPGKFTYGSWSSGSSGHLITEWLKKQTGMRMEHVPYRTTTQLLTDLSSGVLKIGWADPASPVSFVRSGRIRGIAISGNMRAPLLPELPTMGEQGQRFDAVGWFGLFAPAGTSAAIVRRLSTEVNKIQNSPEVAKAMANMNFDPPPVKTQPQFQERVARDSALWKKIAADADIRLDN